MEDIFVGQIFPL